MDDTTKHIALQRIHALFKLARQTLPNDPALAQRYANMARNIAMASRLRLPVEYRRRLCPHCKSFILPGINCRVRTKQHRNPHVVITCLTCGEQTRISLRKKRPKMRR